MPTIQLPQLEKCKWGEARQGKQYLNVISFKFKIALKNDESTIPPK